MARSPLQPTHSPGKAPHTSQEPSPSWEVPECPPRARIGTPNSHKAQQLGAACPRSRCSCPAAQVAGHQLRKRHQSLGFHRNKKKKTFPEKAASIEREIERREHSLLLRWACRCAVNGLLSALSKPPSLPTWQVLKGHLLASWLPPSPQASKSSRPGLSSPRPHLGFVSFSQGVTKQRAREARIPNPPDFSPSWGNREYSGMKRGKFNLKQKTKIPCSPFRQTQELFLYPILGNIRF